MPTRSLESRKKMAAAQRARWAKLRAAEVIDHGPEVLPPPATVNGHCVEHRIILRVNGSEENMTLDEARRVRDALIEALPTP